jgi:hypothetical protein
MSQSDDTAVMSVHSCSKNGVASLAYVAGIRDFCAEEGADGRSKPGHDA